MDPWEEARIAVAGMVESACAKAGIDVHLSDILRSLEDAKPGFGDIACTLAFDLAKIKKANPKQLADSIASNLPKHELVEKAEVAGPYINFHLSRKFISKTVGAIAESDGEFGKGGAKNSLIYVEFPSVNPNKPWHAGHLRNALLGDALARILSFAGYKTKRLDYIDDLGLQVAQSLWGYLNLDDKMDAKADQWLGKQYVEVAKKVEDEKVNAEIRALMKKMEEGNNEVSEKARKLAEKCVHAQYETAFRLNIYHDLLVWESDLVAAKLLDAALEKAKESKAVVVENSGKNKGCLVAKLEGLEEFANMESPDKILLRSDGTATYTAKDLSFQMWKFGLLDKKLRYSRFLTQPNNQPLLTSTSLGHEEKMEHANVVVNVIGVEQKYPQRVLAVILEAMGFIEQAKNSVHLAYEHVGLPETKFSGREGTWLGYSADEVLDEAEARALAEIKNRFTDMGDEEKTKIAKSVGLGAVRFEFLRATPEKKIAFKWEDAINFEGDSAPYVQYMHARACRIIEKAGNGDVGKGDTSLLTNESERKLILMLAHFPSLIQNSASAYRPHVVAEYLLDLAAQFSKFYDASPVLKAEPKLRDARLKLVQATRDVIRTGLSLLGIDAPERM